MIRLNFAKIIIQSSFCLFSENDFSAEFVQDTRVVDFGIECHMPKADKGRRCTPLILSYISVRICIYAHVALNLSPIQMRMNIIHICKSLNKLCCFEKKKIVWSCIELNSQKNGPIIYYTYA